MKPALIFPLLLALSIMACKKPTEALGGDIYSSEPSITSASIFDTLPAKVLSGISITEIDGIKVTYHHGRCAYYLEYEADQQQLLKIIASLPFSAKATRADTLCRQVSANSVSTEVMEQYKSIRTAAYFFLDINPEEFIYYECIKSPVKHTILISKNSNRILHRIEADA